MQRDTTMRSGLSLLAFAAAVAVSGSARADLFTLTDTEFLDSSWSLTSIAFGPFGGGGSASHDAGREGGGRFVTNNAGPNNSGAWNFSMYTPFVYNPAVGGPLSSLSFSVDSRFANGLSAIGFAVEQGGAYWQVGYFINTADWATYAITPTTVDFTCVAGAPTGSLPDFSAAGAPIHFGFFSANSTSAGGSGYSNSGWYDNWSVTFVPAPGSLLALAGALALRRRRA